MAAIDYLRRHRARRHEPILAVIDFETPSAHGAQAYGLARSSHAPLEDAIVEVGLNELFALNVPDGSGGRALRRRHPHRHPGALSQRHAGGGHRRRRALLSHRRRHARQGRSPRDSRRRCSPSIARSTASWRRRSTRFATRDPALWRAEVALPSGGRRARSRGPRLRRRRAAAGRRQPSRRCCFEDDFFEIATARGRSDGDGAARLTLAAAGSGAGRRFLHVSAGARWPLCEVVRPVCNVTKSSPLAWHPREQLATTGEHA